MMSGCAALTFRMAPEKFRVAPAKPSVPTVLRPVLSAYLMLVSCTALVTRLSCTIQNTDFGFGFILREHVEIVLRPGPGVERHAGDVLEAALVDLRRRDVRHHARDFVLLEHLRDREAVRRPVRADEQIDVVDGRELLVEADRGRGDALIVVVDELDRQLLVARADEHAAGLVELALEHLRHLVPAAGERRVDAGDRNGRAEDDRAIARVELRRGGRGRMPAPMQRRAMAPMVSSSDVLPFRCLV